MHWSTIALKYYFSINLTHKTKTAIIKLKDFFYLSLMYSLVNSLDKKVP